MNTNIDLTDPSKVFSKVLSDGIRNTIFFAFATFILILVMNYVNWRFISFIPSLIMVVFFAIGWLKFIILDLPLAIITPFIVFIERKKRKPSVSQQRYLFFGNIVQVFENGATFFYFLLLYRAFYHDDLFGILKYIGVN